jgi:predicted transcriptional regulator of viral defense system
MSSQSKANRTLELAQRAGVLRSRDLARHGVERQYLAILTRRGKLHRAGRGLYVPADANLTENHSLAEATKRVSNGVVCLLSALRFHNLGTQLPSAVWMAIDRKAWAPKMNGIRLRVVRFSRERAHIRYRAAQGGRRYGQGFQSGKDGCGLLQISK